MLSKRVLILVLGMFVWLGICTVPVTQGQGDGLSFVGRWEANVQFPGGAPPLVYWIIAEESPGDGLFFIENDRSGGGFAVGPCNFGPGSAKFSGLSWRHTPLNGDPVDGGGAKQDGERTGISASIDFRSGRTPITIILRGQFMSGDLIEGSAISVDDTADDESVTGFTGSIGTVTLTRLADDADICGLGVPFPFGS